MSEARFDELIQKQLIAWLKKYSGKTSIKEVISEEQRFMAPKPLSGDFITYKITNFSQNGEDEGTYNPESKLIDYYGQRDFQVSIIIYAFDSMKIAKNLVNSLNKPGAIEILGIAKLSWSDVECKNVSALLDSGYEQRAAIDINFHTALEYEDEESNYIEEVDFASSLRDAKEEVLNGTFSIKQEE